MKRTGGCATVRVRAVESGVVWAWATWGRAAPSTPSHSTKAAASAARHRRKTPKLTCQLLAVSSLGGQPQRGRRPARVAPATRPTASYRYRLRTVVLDAGHGGKTTAATARTMTRPT
ncbi:hypothetical protein MRB53_041959 [Persea americana]|nr:hypothetical protein MRB53_041959 [Persea americana]